MMNHRANHRGAVEPSVFVIFGGTGDLAKRKLLPAILHLINSKRLEQSCHILAVARSTDFDDQSYRGLVKEALSEAGFDAEQISNMCSEHLHFQSIKNGEDADFLALKDRIEKLEEENSLPQNRTFYLALPPAAFAKTVTGLGKVGLNRSSGWTRVLVEKPFGHDLQSARELNQIVHEYFEENQLYRIDHYLGKETVQNILVFRFANAIFESLFNRDKVDSVQISVAETLGVESRAKYYDQSGALRDMVQNHMMQILSLIAMEVPAQFDADSIRYEKIKVLKSIASIMPEDVVFGQYSTGAIDGDKVASYLDEKDIPADSQTETFVALKIQIDNWRWQGVPFYLRTGKRQPKRMTQIALRFKNTPVCMFKDMGGVCIETSNLMVITLQPDEGFHLHFDVKRPGSNMDLVSIPLSFRYKDMFGNLPEAYETLLYDVLTGDQTLFVHSDEVEASWQLIEPLLSGQKDVHLYKAGTWGPTQAKQFSIPELYIQQFGMTYDGKRVPNTTPQGE
jgi:glucose-6-phosphate 1-dehydrogenase